MATRKKSETNSVPVNMQGGEISSEAPQYAAPALEKGLDILELLTDAEHGMSMAEIAQGLGRGMSEIFRMVLTLQRRGWVSVDKGDRYHLSSRMFELAHRNRPVRTLVEAAISVMQVVAKQARQSCHLSIVERGRIMVIAQVEAPGNLAFGVRTGSLVGLFNTASGQVHLAFRSDEERQRLIEDHALISGEPGLRDPDWRGTLDQVATNGFACSASMQVRGVTNIGYPVWGRNGQVVAAIVIPYMEGIDAQRGPSLEDAIIILADGAAEISRSLGYQPKKEEQ